VGSKIKEAILSIGKLVDGEYKIQQFQDNQTISSAIFPNLRLIADQMLKVGR
jgi:Uma2 family endonuclease